MLSRFDDYPIHQTPEPIAQPLSSDRNVYDRYWFNGYAEDGEYYFGIGAAVYPNLGIMDCGFSIVRDGEQHAFHASRRIPREPSRVEVGPFRIDILEPMMRLRVVVDDAYISFQFARHLNQGHGLVWNVGDPPVEGYSNFLWVMLLSLTDRLGIDYAVAGLGLGIAAGLGTLAYGFAFARRWLGPHNMWSWFLLVWLAAAGPLASWSSARSPRAS